MPEMTPEAQGRAIRRFDYQAPTAQNTADIVWMRDECKRVAARITSLPMDERCRIEALLRLEEVSMWVNKGIVFDNPAQPPQAVDANR